jgi:uncharacterized protein
MLVRTVTTFLPLPRERRGDWPAAAARAAAHNDKCRSALVELGYVVQTTRVITSPFLEWADGTDADSFVKDVGYVRSLVPVEHSLSIGALLPPASPASHASHASHASPASPAPLSVVTSLLPAAIRAHGVSASVHVPVDSNGVPDYDTALAAATAIRLIADTTEGGEGNFCFAAASHGRDDGLEGCPFFPSGMTAATDGPLFCTVGLQFADALVDALSSALGDAGLGTGTGTKPEGARGAAWARGAQAIRDALTPHLAAVARAVMETGRETGVEFRGIDASAAPAPSAKPLTRAFELLGVKHFGSAGTLEASAFLTRVLKGLAAHVDGRAVPLVGYTGLMLPPTEDIGLAEGAARAVEGGGGGGGAPSYTILDLLQYSAVCGIGLDTVPIPGDTPAASIAALICDVVSLSARLAKPLSVRLFPVPGLRAGDMTAFTNPHLCNTRVFAVP